jgi:hypothetical protein
MSDFAALQHLLAYWSQRRWRTLFGYRDWRTRISMKLPLMPIYMMFPGHYRTRAQTMADFAANKEIESGLRR